MEYEAFLANDMLAKDMPPESEPVANANNGFLLVLGLNANQGSNQLEVGIKRLESLRNENNFDKSPQANIGIEFHSLKTELSDLALDCPSPESSIFECLNSSSSHFERAVNITNKWQWYLDRYIHILKAGTWHESIIYNLHNMPSYGGLGLREGQKLLFLQSYLMLKQGDSFVSSELISRDYQFWLGQLAKNKTLLAMMISLEGGKENLKWGISLQKTLPTHFQGPLAWSKALEKDEIEETLRRMFLYEWQFGQTLLSDMMKRSGSSTG